MNKFTFNAVPALLAGAVFVSGCTPSSDKMPDSSASTSTSGSASIPSTTTPSATEAPQRSNTGAQVKPPAGFGNAQGRVLWNEKPASGIRVQLCQSVSFIGGCSGKTYPAKTDKDGNYTIDKVPPGEYGLAVQVFDTDTFIYPTDGFIGAAKYKIEDGQTLDIRATNLFKTDLQTLSPRVGETVKTGLPMLKWKPYTNAAKYEIRVVPKGSGADLQSMETADTQIAPDSPLLNGDYSFEVVARNANGVKIAETREGTPFKVAGQSGSSKVTLDFPRVNSTVAGSGLVFKWQKHPLADGYQIYLNAKEGQKAILAFENVADTSYPLTQALPPGSYFWSVNATKDGKKIASSELQSFQVK